jgi:hypothetical protein
MNTLLIDLLNGIDTLIATLGPPGAFDSDAAAVAHRAAQLDFDVRTALAGAGEVDLNQLAHWRAELDALSDWLVENPVAGADTEEYVLVGIVEGTTVADVDAPEDWRAGRLANDPAYHDPTDLDQLSGSALPGDPVSEPNPDDLPPRRPRR